ncbi:MAG: hypothetical protein WD768_04610 [Phycisphaeraceae bacterium]
MRRFILEIMLFFAVQIPLVVFLIARFPTLDNEMMAIHIDKQHRAAMLAGGPRVFMVGGSSVAYGYHSEIVEEELGIPAVNLGISGHTGFDFQLSEAEQTARKGDVVVVSIEYLVLGKPQLVNNDFLFATLMCRPQSISFVPLPRLKVLLDGGLPVIRVLIRSAIRGRRNSPLYTRDGFNEYGDFVRMRGQPSQYLPPQPGEPGPVIDDDGRLEAYVDRIDGFIRRCEARGIRVFLMYCPYAPAHFATHSRPIRLIAAALNERFGDRLLCKPEETVFPNAMIADWVYHIGDEAGKIYSRLMAQRVKEKLGAPSR